MPSLNGHNNTDDGRAARSAGPTGKAYWRSLDELTGTDEFQQFVEKEFADYKPEQVLTAPTRRGFMKLMGASMALGGASAMSGCRRWPVRQIAPYNERPEGRVPGEPVYYATAFEVAGVGRPLLVSTMDGRPTKVEGNPDHPQSAGAADTLSQASVLEMYDPERSRHVLHNGERSSWQAFFEAAAAWDLGEEEGGGVAVLSEAGGSPALALMRQRLADAMPEARWYEYEAVNRDNELAGAELAFGSPARTHLHLENADVIVALDADILGGHPNALQHARQWALRRHPDRADENGGMSRLWAIDPVFTVTSTNADHRLPTAAGSIGDVVKALAAELGLGGDRPELNEKASRFVAALAADLRDHEGRSLLAVGPRQPAAVHAAAHLINQALGNLGETITVTEEPASARQADQLRELAQRMEAGEVRTLMMLGTNPVYSAPADVDFRAALERVEHTAHLSHYVDETSVLCEWHLPRAHYLEAWGAVRSWDGAVTIQQPQIRPLYGSRSAIEVLAGLLDDEADGRQIVRQAVGEWLTDERGWRRVLHDGMIEDSGFEPATVQVDAEAVAEALAELPAAGDGVELTLAPDYSVYDGRFANNGWLQELPDPITKLTWDNAAVIGPATAQDLGLTHGDPVRITVGERAMNAAVFIVPGTARGSVAVALGYGRTAAGYVGDDVGFDAFQVRAGEVLDIAGNVQVERRSGPRYTLATTQNHHAIDATGRRERERRAFSPDNEHLIRTATKQQYDAYLALDPEERPYDQFAIEPRAYLPREQQRRPLQLFESPVDFSEGYQWGMSIDLSTCIGCNACVVACQAENNVPIVGKAEVARGREMHWIRVDRYFGGDDPENPDVAHQVMTCQHCDNAPCEQVCPVAATVHDTQGINVMIYNRCIGTRYCSNNCPYKVRRFNYFDWHSKPPREGHVAALDLDWPDRTQNKRIDPIRRMQFNPEVTVRMRGVMEKCTFCQQRIKTTTIKVRNAVRRGERESLDLADGEIVPACAQTCPTQAIRFGDINNGEHQVARDRAHPRNYEVLRDLNTRTRLRYLAKVTNPAARLAADQADVAGEREA